MFPCSSACSAFSPNFKHYFQPDFQSTSRQSLGGRPLCLFLSNRLPRRDRLLLALRAGCLRFPESFVPNSYHLPTIDVLYCISVNRNLLGLRPKFFNHNFTILVHSRPHILFAWISLLTYTSLVAVQHVTSAFSVVVSAYSS
jgi:hypothetical protein